MARAAHLARLHSRGDFDELNGLWMARWRTQPPPTRPAPLPARTPGRGPGGRGTARRRARHPLDQDHRQGLRDRPGDPDGRPDHARGRRHPRQGAGAGQQGDAAGPVRPDLPRGGGGLRLPRHGPLREGDAGFLRRTHRLGGHRLPQRSRRDGHQARRRQGRRRRGCRRGRHGDRPGRVPLRALHGGLRGDRRRARGVRPARREERAPQGDLRDRRAADLRQRTTGQLAGDDGRSGLHQDLDRARSSPRRPCR